MRVRANLARLMVLGIVAISCGGSYEETVAGVKVPVPKEMSRNDEKPVEISLFGFGAGQASFRGNVPPEKLVDFYKTEMAARGWQPSMKLQSGAAMLAYTKENRTVLVAIGQEKNETVLNLTVGAVGR